MKGNIIIDDEPLVNIIVKWLIVILIVMLCVLIMTQKTCCRNAFFGAGIPWGYSQYGHH